MLGLILINQFWMLVIQSGVKRVRWENGIKYHDALVGAMVLKGICGLSIILCSITTNTSSPPLLLLFLGIPSPSRITWLERLGVAYMPAQRLSCFKRK